MKKFVLLSILALTLGQGTARASSPIDVRLAQEKVRAFTQALVESDRATLEALLSKRMLDKIATKGQAAGLSDPLSSYIERERTKLLRTLENKQPDNLDVTELTPTDDTSVLASLSLSGRNLSKPLRLVLEDGTYKVDPGRVETMSSSTYLVYNRTSDYRFVGCSDNRYYWVRPTQCYWFGCFSSPLGCVDHSCGWFSDGTDFVYTQPGASGPSTYRCDYNTYGDDFVIESDGYGHCVETC